jgi:hypothetical protein
MIKVYHRRNNKKHHDVILNELKVYLTNKYNVELIISDNDIHLTDRIGVSDCSLLIEDKENNVFKGITFADNPYKLLPLFQERNNPNDILLISQYNEHEIKSANYQCKLKKSIYIPSFPDIDLDYYYNKRRLIEEYIDKFYFRGNIGAVNRNTVHVLHTQFFNGGHSINIDEYFNELTKYKVGLCIPGVGEFCYRDIEYMGIGIPMMKFQYINELYYPLIPNYHYISIDRLDNDFSIERNGGEKYAESYTKRFLEIKDNKEFLNFISNNARKYYEEYLHPSIRLNHIINLLEI